MARILCKPYSFLIVFQSFGVVIQRQVYISNEQENFKLSGCIFTFSKDI